MHCQPMRAFLLNSIFLRILYGIFTLDWYLHEYLTSEGVHEKTGLTLTSVIVCFFIIHCGVLVYAWLGLCVPLCTI